MAEQIMFLKKSKMDLTQDAVSITATQGNDFVDFLRNRKNTSGWATSGSVDADNTTVTVQFGNTVDIDCIALISHNLKAYTLKYWNGSAYTNFSTTIAETTNTATTKFHQFTSVATTAIQLIITGTMTANDDKFLAQMIATELIGQLNGWPVIKDPIHSRMRKRVKTISGKESIREQIGNFSCDIEVKITSDSTDLGIVEDLFESNEGFYVWLCGGDATQYRVDGLKGYRLEDWFLVKCANEYTPAFYKGLYQAGLPIKMDLQEVID